MVSTSNLFPEKGTKSILLSGTKSDYRLAHASGNNNNILIWYDTFFLQILNWLNFVKTL